MKKEQLQEMFNEMLNRKLNESWESFLKEGIYIDQRYGQWHYNLYKHEVGNSYNIERPYKAYQVLYDDIVNSGNIEDSE